MARRLNLGRAIAVLLAVQPSSWVGAQTYTVQSITAPAYANLAAGATGTTSFQNTGTVTKLSGNGAVISGATVRATITIACADGNGNPRRCSTAGNNARIAVGTSGVTSGRAGAFTDMTAVSGTGTVGAGTTTGAGPLDFVLSGWTAAGNKTFFLNTTLPIAGDDAGGATGAATSGFYVYAAKDPTVPATGSTGLATATVRRSLQIVKLTDLEMGVVVRPATGSGTVLIDATTGVRSTGGGNPPALALGQPSGRASFTITGEPSTAYTITVPASATITSGANNLTVTLTSTASGAQTMGVGGTLTLGVGSTTTILTGTPSGAYSGSFIISIVYN